MRRAALAALLLVAWVLPARAAFDDLGAGARATGMGNAFVPVADDVYAIYYNPAGLGLLERPQFTASYTKLYMGLSDGSDLGTSFVGYANPLMEGRQGTLATAWNSFSLNNSLYKEQTFYLSYGRQWFNHPDYGDLYAGISLKYLQSNFGSFDEASNATLANSIAKSGQQDPVLSQNKSQGAFDADLGMLYRFNKHYALGVQATHVPQPNIAFSASDTDRLPLGLKIGINYRSFLSNLVAELDSQRSPTGTQDKTLTVAAERWFPRIFIGDFGVRSGLGLGTRDYKQVSLGMSYRTKRMEIDYSFAIPINTIATPVGSHRVALSFRFGKATDEEESLEMVLEAMRQLKAGRMVEHKIEGNGLSMQQSTTLEDYLAQVHSLLAAAEYKKALDKFSLALTIVPSDKNLIAQYGRLNFIGQQIKDLPEYKTNPVQAALHEGLLAYLGGKDLEAVQKVAYALSLKPDYRELEIFLSQLELVTGIKRMGGLKVEPRDYTIAEKLTRANSAIQDGKYSEAIELSLAVIKQDPQNARAWQNLGTAYFALKDFDNSIKAWEKAYQYEESHAIRTAIKGYLKSISRAKVRRASSPAVKPQPLPERPIMSVQERQDLFNQGIDHYTRREFEKAKEAFEKILQANPEDDAAQKALRRVKEELP